MPEHNSPGRPLQGAVIGFGNVAINAHVPLWQQNPNFDIEAVVEPSPARAALVSRVLPGATVYPDEKTLLANHELDFVDICTPPCFHADQIMAACRAGV
ncbi:MAG: Gfo/Idh/MocA family oxidoreductase, partial [Deltaproteobacteria bacterium]|nr:Gfo/Idh/MocA family oxidoreductase [Deltaproteobacteria bacterium]